MNTVYLRALEVNDLERTFRWHNDPDLYKTLIGSFHFVSRATEAAWLENKQSFLNQEINLAICLSETDQHIGNVYIRDIDWISRRGEFHIFIGERDQRSKGYGRIATQMVIHHCFNNLGLNRLGLLVQEENVAAVKTYLKCGFSQEGKLRQYTFKDGKFRDVLIMGVCATDRPLWEENL